MRENAQLSLRRTLEFAMEVVIFDLDETLLDRAESLKRFCKWQAQFQCRLDKSHIDHYVSRFIELDRNGTVWKDSVYDTLTHEFCHLKVSTDDLLSTYLSDFWKFCTPKAGAPEAVRTLHDMGYRLALISNGKSPFQERNFEALGLTLCFDEVVVSDAVGCKKPDEQIFSITCSRLEVEPSNCVFVGDNPIADIQGAAAVGMYTIYVPGHFGTFCPGADAICTNFKDLPDLVRNAR